MSLLDDAALARLIALDAKYSFMCKRTRAYTPGTELRVGAEQRCNDLCARLLDAEAELSAALGVTAERIHAVYRAYMGTDVGRRRYARAYNDVRENQHTDPDFQLSAREP